MNDQGIKRLLKDLDAAPDEAARVEIVRALTRKVDALALAEASFLAKERHRLKRIRRVAGWVGLVLCANYTALAATVHDGPDVIFNVVFAVVWAAIALVNFKTT